MKIKILALLLVYTTVTYAQRYENAFAIQAKYGIMKGEGQIIKDIATASSLGGQLFIGQKGYFFESNLLFHDFSVDYKQVDKNISYQLYGLNLMGGWSFENLEPFYFNIKAGGFAGYYIVNKGIDKDETYGTTFVNPVKGITYGALTALEAEIVIWKKLAGVVSYSQYFYPNDGWIRWQYAIEAGFKWYM